MTPGGGTPPPPFGVAPNSPNSQPGPPAAGGDGADSASSSTNSSDPDEGKSVLAQELALAAVAAWAQLPTIVAGPAGPGGPGQLNLIYRTICWVVVFNSTAPMMRQAMPRTISNIYRTSRLLPFTKRSWSRRSSLPLHFAAISCTYRAVQSNISTFLHRSCAVSSDVSTVTPHSPEEFDPAETRRRIRARIHRRAHCVVRDEWFFRRSAQAQRPCR